MAKIPTASGIRYTVSTLYMHQDGGIGMDCIQYIQSGNSLTVRYTGRNAINANGTISTATASNLHILAVLGTDIDIWYIKA